MKKECVDFYLWMQKKGYDHNIKTRIENKYNEYELEQLTPTAVVQVKPEKVCICNQIIKSRCTGFCPKCNTDWL